MGRKNHVAEPILRASDVVYFFLTENDATTPVHYQSNGCSPCTRYSDLPVADRTQHGW